MDKICFKVYCQEILNWIEHTIKVNKYLLATRTRLGTKDEKNKIEFSLKIKQKATNKIWEKWECNQCAV